MKWLETILSSQGVDDETRASILEEAKKQKLIPKERFDTVNNQLKEANTSLNNVNSELETLKGQVKNNEVLEKQISDLQATHTKSIEEYEGKIKEMKIHDYIKGEMVKDLKDPKYFDLLYKEVDHSKLTVGEDGSVSGFDLKPFQEKYTDLFGAAPTGMGSVGNPPRGGVDPGKESVGKMLAELNKDTTSIKENPYF